MRVADSAFDECDLAAAGIARGSRNRLFWLQRARPRRWHWTSVRPGWSGGSRGTAGYRAGANRLQSAAGLETRCFLLKKIAESRPRSLSCRQLRIYRWRRWSRNSEFLPKKERRVETTLARFRYARKMATVTRPLRVFRLADHVFRLAKLPAIYM